MKIFIDLGSHVGESIINFRDIIDTNQDFKIYGFEPHPVVFEKLKYNIEKYKNNSNIDLFDRAGYINDNDANLYQHVNLYKMKLEDQRKNYKEIFGDGSSSLNINKTNVSKEESITIKCTDIASFLKKNITKNDYVILKMDIEGTEYELIPHLIENNIFNMIDIFFVEFHSGKVKINSKLDKKLMNNIKDQNENILIITEEQARTQQQHSANGNWFHMIKNIT